LKIFFKKQSIAFFIFALSMLVITVPKSQEIREADECLKCHTDDFGPTGQVQHPLIKEKKCMACHNSYDISTHQEFEKPVLDACTRCHDEGNMGRSHPVGYGIIDPNTNDEMTCVSTCHTPHGSRFKFQLPFKNNMDLCISCHDF